LLSCKRLKPRGNIATLSKELLKYAEFLRTEFGAVSQWSPDSALSLLSSGVETALSPTPDRFVTLAAILSKSAAGAQRASKRWWYRRKLALISKTIRAAGKAQALTNEVERLFGKKVSKDEVLFFQTILTGPAQGSGHNAASTYRRPCHALGGDPADPVMRRAVPVERGQCR
jgi:hypothetical protein